MADVAFAITAKAVLKMTRENQRDMDNKKESAQHKPPKTSLNPIGSVNVILPSQGRAGHRKRR